MTTRKNVTVAFLFCCFSLAVILVQSGRQIAKKVKMHLLKHFFFFSKKAHVKFFRVVMKNNPANFVFQLLFNQGAKA